METNPDQRTSEEAGATLQLKRSLLPIDEYAAREGLSRDIIEECGKLGVVQIRRYKGKTFVVDVPLSPYLCASEAAERAAKPVDKGSHFAKVPQNGVPDIRETAEELTKSNNESIKAGAISALVEKMFHKASEITGKPVKTPDEEDGQVKKVPGSAQVIHHKAPESIDQSAKLTSNMRQVESVSESIQMMPFASAEIVNERRSAADGSTQTEHRPESAQSDSVPIKARKTPQFVSQKFRKAGQIISKLTETASDKTVESEEKAESAQIIEDNGIQFSVLPDSEYKPYFEESQNEELAGEVRSKRGWQVVALFLIVFLFATLFANVWFYMDRRVQLDRLDQAYASIRSVYNDFIRAGQQAEALQKALAESGIEIRRMQSGLDKSRAEVKRIQNELDSAGAELTTVRNELAEARQNLEVIQHRNTQAVERLKGQIKKLTAWLRESNRSPQPPSGSGVSGQ